MSGLFDLAVPRGLRRSFVLATACSAVIWASYAFWLGRRGGQAFEGKPWVGFVLAFGVAIGVSALIEVSRRLYARYQARRQGAGAPAGPGPDPEMAACELAAEGQPATRAP
jgi:membrane-associated protein